MQATQHRLFQTRHFLIEQGDNRRRIVTAQRHNKGGGASKVRTDTHFGDSQGRAFQGFWFKIKAMQHIAQTLAQHLANPQLPLACFSTASLLIHCPKAAR
jgi:hypothetical protein